jgi:hypothetical protein
MECLRLRVMDLDFAKSQVYFRGKGGKDRLTTLPQFICGDLKAHPSHVKKLHEADLDARYGDVYLPRLWLVNIATLQGNIDGNMFFQLKRGVLWKPCNYLPYQITNITVNKIKRIKALLGEERIGGLDSSLFSFLVNSAALSFRESLSFTLAVCIKILILIFVNQIILN